MDQYRYESFYDLIDDVLDDSERPGAPAWQAPVMWSKSRTPPWDKKYADCMVLPNVDPDEWTPCTIHALNARLKEEFKLKHDFYWLGVVRHGKRRGAEPSSTCFHDLPGYNLAFLIHDEDKPNIRGLHRCNLGFRWLSEMTRRGCCGMKSRYPPDFIRACESYGFGRPV